MGETILTCAALFNGIQNFYSFGVVFLFLWKKGTAKIPPGIALLRKKNRNVSWVDNKSSFEKPIHSFVVLPFLPIIKRYCISSNFLNAITQAVS